MAFSDTSKKNKLFAILVIKVSNISKWSFELVKKNLVHEKVQEFVNILTLAGRVNDKASPAITWEVVTCFWKVEGTAIANERSENEIWNPSIIPIEIKIRKKVKSFCE